MIRINRLMKSFRYALKGLIKTFREEQNFRVQSVAGLAILILAAMFRITIQEWSLLIFVISLVLLMELSNSALERVTDILKPRISSYVMEIKDIMAAAVMLASIVSIIIGILIFFPYIAAKF